MKIRVNTINPASTLRAVEGKMLLFTHCSKIIIIFDVKIEIIDEPCGWRNKKTRPVTYLTGCKIYGFNDDGEFVGTYDEDTIRTYLTNWDFLKLRRNYLDFEKQRVALKLFLEAQPEFKGF